MTHWEVSSARIGPPPMRSRHCKSLLSNKSIASDNLRFSELLRVNPIADFAVS